MNDGLKDALQRIGAPRIEATLIGLLHREPDVSTKEAVEATELRQPEVSVGMRDLVNRGWVECEPIPREGKGRPMNRYRLTADLARLHIHYEALAEQSRAELDAAVQALSGAFSTPLA